MLDFQEQPLVQEGPSTSVPQVANFKEIRIGSGSSGQATISGGIWRFYDSAGNVSIIIDPNG